MFKKTACFIALCLIFVFNVSAADEFYVYGDNNEKVSQILNMSESELEKYCSDNGITYLAVNGDNTKQVKRAETVDDFSKEVFDMSLLSNDKIKALSSELSGFSNASGEVVEYNDLKFLKTEHKTTDSGGEFILTQYVTVEKSEKTVLTFYTAENTDRSYVEEIFKSQFSPVNDFAGLIIVGLCVFGIFGIAVLILIFKDIKKDKE